MPSFYSLEQVIEIVSKIEDPEPKSTTVMPMVDFEKMCDDVQSTVSRMLSDTNFDEIIDTDSAEFDICDRNTIQLYSVDVFYDDISETVTEIAADVIKRYVQVIEPNDDRTENSEKTIA